MAQIVVNSTVGHEPREGQTIFHLYIYVYNGSTHIETADINLPVARVLMDVTQTIIDAELSDLPEDLRKSPSRREFVMSNIRMNMGIKLHVMYDSMSKHLYLLDDSDNAKKGTDQYQQAVMAIRDVGRWISETPQYFGEVDRKDMTYIPTPRYRAFSEYRLMKVKDLPLIKEMSRTAKFDLETFDNIPVFFFDFEDGEVSKEFKSQISAFDTSKTAFLCLYPFQLVKQTRQEPQVLLRIPPPFIAVNDKIGAEYSAADTVLNILMFFSKANAADVWSSALEQKYRIGYDAEDIFMVHFGSQTIAQQYEQSMASSNEVVFVEGSAANNYAKRLGIDPKVDPEIAEFLQVFRVYHEVFPHNDTKRNYKRFYYFVSVEGDRDHPAIEYQQLFDNLFRVLPQATKKLNGRTYFVVASTYCFPPRVFNFFGDMIVQDSVNLNTVNGVLSRTLSYAEQGDKSADQSEALTYRLQVLPEFGKYIERINGSSLKDNRMDEALSLKSISEFPYVDERVHRMAESRGLPFRDIQVILTYDKRNSGSPGGFVGRLLNTQKAMKIMANLRPFQLPFIMLNMASDYFDQHENIAVVLIHEYSHYLDEIAIEEGKADKKSMDAPSLPSRFRSQREIQDFWKQYLTAPTEFTAHVNQALDTLRAYSSDVIVTNWPNLKDYVIRRQFLPEQDGDESFYVRYKLYSDIMDKALEIRLKDEDVQAELVESDPKGVQ